MSDTTRRARNLPESVARFARGSALLVALVAGAAPAVFFAPAACAGEDELIDPQDQSRRDIREKNVPLTDEVKAKIAELQARAEQNPRDAMKVAEYGYALVKVGRIEEGVSALSRAAAISPDEPKVHLLRARGLWKSKDLDGAVESAQKAAKSPLAAAKDAGEALRLVGSIRFEQGRLEEAKSAFEEGTRVDPTNAATYANLGAMYLSWKKNVEALSALDKAARLGHSNAGVLVTVARLYQGSGRFELAKPVWDRVLELRPTDADVAQIAATHHFRDAEYDQALSALEVAVKGKPQDAEVRLMYSQTLLRLGRFEEARKAAIEAQKLGAGEIAIATQDAIEMERKQGPIPPR